MSELGEKKAVEGLSKFTGESREVTVAGETFTIRPFTIGQLGKVMNEVGVLTRFADSEGEINLVEAFASGSDAILNVAALATKKDRAWFDTVEVDEGLNLILAIYEVNQDFFARRVQPVFQRMAPSLRGPLNGA